MIAALVALLVLGLGHEDYRVRDACEEVLVRAARLGAPDAAIKKGLDGPDAEVRRRCKRVLARTHRVWLWGDLYVWDFQGNVDENLLGRFVEPDAWPFASKGHRLVDYLLFEEGWPTEKVQKAVDQAEASHRQAYRFVGDRPARPWHEWRFWPWNW